MNPKNVSSKPQPGPITIVIPAKNEEAAIGATLHSLPVATLAAAGFDCDVVILDGNSTDATADIARSYGAMVVTDQEDGKGAALRHGIPHLRGEYIVMLDADGTYAADAIPMLVDALARGDFDIVMGQRTALPGSMSGLHRLGNSVLSLGASMIYGHLCPDLCTGLWGFRRQALESLPLQSQGFELEAEMFALASRLDMRVGHSPVDYLPRRGETKLSATRDGLRIGWCLVRTRFGHVDALPSPGTGAGLVGAARKGRETHGTNGTSEGVQA